MTYKTIKNKYVAQLMSTCSLQVAGEGERTSAHAGARVQARLPRCREQLEARYQKLSPPLQALLPCRHAAHQL